MRPVLKQASEEFGALIDKSLPRRPLVGINGEIYLRSNNFSNKDLVRTCEKAGLEVVVSPMGEWFKYVAHRNLEDAVKDRKVKKMLMSYLKKNIQTNDEHSIASNIQTSFPKKSQLQKRSWRNQLSSCLRAAAAKRSSASAAASIGWRIRSMPG